MEATKYSKLVDLILISGINTEKINVENIKESTPEILFLYPDAKGANSLLEVNKIK